MNAFLTGIGTRLADRWINALLLPGLLWSALLAAGLYLGQDRSFAVAGLSGWLDQLASRPAAQSIGAVVLAASAILLASAGVGLLAGAFGALVERLWALPGDRPPASWLRSWRRRRWALARERLRTAIRDAATDSGADNALAHATAVRVQQRRCNRLGLARPDHATRIGDRLADAATHARTVDGLDDLALAWPRLWSVMSSEVRADLAAARDAYAAAARLAAWALLYLTLAVVWWPAALVGTAALIASALRGNAAANVLASLIEAACDLYLRDLADRLGVPSDEPALDIGHAISQRLRTPRPTEGPSRRGGW
ncbi:hypothetical protein ABZW44_26035 [Streptomyces mirabilis]|uniref:hypothetical protein n=1 Tax=Streptomyces mirabilis TaxID=68239 RepID=UPI00331FCD1E